MCEDIFNINKQLLHEYISFGRTYDDAFTKTRTKLANQKICTYHDYVRALSVKRGNVTNIYVLDDEGIAYYICIFPEMDGFYCELRALQSE